MKILVNHVGYELTGPKRAVIEAPEAAALSAFRVRRPTSADVVLEGSVERAGPVARWKKWFFWTADFSSVRTPGKFVVEVKVGDQWVRSEVFDIAEELFISRTLADVLGYFWSQRCAGQFDAADRRAPFFGERQGHADVHGGWYDAAGDTSKYLSHLSYASFMNPQQTPIVVWNMLEAADRLDASGADRVTVRQLRAEAQHGADFLVRMQDPAGYFYATVFDRWSKDVDQREICAYKTQKGFKLETHQAAYRQGGGVTIAALARAARQGLAGDYPASRYLEAAVRGFEHLEANNVAYTNDGRENIIDDYCALLAATELFAATSDERFLGAARRRADSLLGRQSSNGSYDGWWRADDGTRPYFHAAEEGLPVVALLRFAELEQDRERVERVTAAVRRWLRFTLAITDEVTNPFGYPRQYVKALDQEPKASFFYPHENESGYWWQGEDARLASLSSAVTRALRQVGDAELEPRLLSYATDCINWILGMNPFDSCMLFGFGRGNVNYEDEWPNVRGGICNGITSGFTDEEDVDFAVAGLGGDQIWRWTEQWIPHTAWYILALAELRALRAARGFGA